MEPPVSQATTHARPTRQATGTARSSAASPMCGGEAGFSPRYSKVPIGAQTPVTEAFSDTSNEGTHIEYYVKPLTFRRRIVTLQDKPCQDPGVRGGMGGQTWVAVV